MSLDIPLAISTDFLTAWSFWIGVGILAGIYGIFTLGLQLNVGYTGILNFGQAGFMALGAYSAVIFVVTLGMPFLLALPLSMLVTMAFGLLVGLPTLRLRADYLAIATIAFSEVVRIAVQNSDTLTGGNQGTISLELENDRIFSEAWFTASDWIAQNIFDPIGLTDPDFLNLPLLAVIWIVLPLLAFGLSRLVRSPWGRVLRAVREDEDAARALGKNVFSYKLQSLAIAAGLGAIAGWFLVLNLQSVNQTAVRADLHLLRLRDPDPRRPRELPRRARRDDLALDRARGPALPRPAARRRPDRGAALHHRRARPDPAGRLPPAGRARQEGGDGAQ